VYVWVRVDPGILCNGTSIGVPNGRRSNKPNCANGHGTETKKPRVYRMITRWPRLSASIPESERQASSDKRRHAWLLLVSFLYVWNHFRASRAAQTRPPAAVFYIRTAVFGSAASLVPRFRLDLCFHPSGEPRPSPAFRGALGDSGGNENTRNDERARGVGERNGSSPPLIFVSLQNAPHIPIFPTEIPHSCSSPSSRPPPCRRRGSPTTARRRRESRGPPKRGRRA
jgi:hypothetical protein